MKISILGCGWSGMAIGRHLSSQGYTVKGSSTRQARLPEIAMNGIIPHLIYASPVPDGRDVDSFFECDTLIVTIPPPKREGVKDWSYMVHSAIARKAVEYGVKRIILMSSTSVYPSKGQLMTETDAEVIESPRSGVAMLDLEKCYSSNWFNKVVLRFGGLFGPGRDPGKFLLPGVTQYNPDAKVNLVHLDDVVKSVAWIIEQSFQNEVFNVVSPDHPSRREFYDAAAALRGVELDWGDNIQQLKDVSSEKIVNKGYQFAFHNPIEALSTQNSVFK
ncbi:MAG: SDR family NAD(P)-dependent oxidoreductase [Flavobacteriales bacterium]|nr:SDR family NAD(P)-dependent oxidoreductase [Flavobacteriales bacterium]